MIQFCFWPVKLWFPPSVQLYYVYVFLDDVKEARTLTKRDKSRIKSSDVRTEKNKTKTKKQAYLLMGVSSKISECCVFSPAESSTPIRDVKAPAASGAAQCNKS